MNSKYEIQCAVSGCTSKRGRKNNISIHRFPKEENAGQRWIEACSNPCLSRLGYLEVLGRQFFICHRHFDEQYFYQKRNGAFLLKYGAFPTLNLPSCSDVSSDVSSDVNIKPASVSSPLDFEILIPEAEIPAEGTRDLEESSVQFAHVSTNIFNFI